jgi:hypothetical protein
VGTRRILCNPDEGREAEDTMATPEDEDTTDLRTVAVETLADKEQLPPAVVRQQIEETALAQGLHFLDAAAVLYERRATGFEATAR